MRKIIKEVKGFTSHVAGISKEEWKLGFISAMTESAGIAGVGIGAGSIGHLGFATASGSVDAAFGGILGIVFMLARYVGTFLAAYGVFTAIMGFRAANSDKTTTGITEAIVGVVLVFLKQILGMIPGIDFL